MWSKLTIKTQEQPHWCRFGIFIVNFEHIPGLVRMVLLLTLNMLLPAGQQLCNLFVILMQHEILQIIKENYVNIKCLSLPVNLKALICICIYRQLTVILCYESIGHMIIFLYQNFISVHMNYETAIEKYRSQTDNFQIILLSISRLENESFVC